MSEVRAKAVVELGTCGHSRVLGHPKVSGYSDIESPRLENRSQRLCQPQAYLGRKRGPVQT